VRHRLGRADRRSVRSPWLVEDRKVEVGQIQELELTVVAPLRDVVDPLADGLTDVARSRAANDDGDFQHRPGAVRCRILLPRNTGRQVPSVTQRRFGPTRPT